MEIELYVQATADGAVQEAHCQLDRRVVVGRDLESPVQIQGPGISREHLALEEQNGRVLISDLSSNGTSVNGSRLEKGKPREIRDGDLIEIPGYQIDFKVVAAPAEDVEVALPEIVEPPPLAIAAPPASKMAFLQPVLHILQSLSFVERLVIICAIASFWLGLYFYSG